MIQTTEQGVCIFHVNGRRRYCCRLMIERKKPCIGIARFGKYVQVGRLWRRNLNPSDIDTHIRHQGKGWAQLPSISLFLRSRCLKF